jgi:hypothetical protein
MMLAVTPAALLVMAMARMCRCLCGRWYIHPVLHPPWLAAQQAYEMACAAGAATRTALCLLQYIIGMDLKNVRDILKASNYWVDKDGSLPALDEVRHPG